MARYLLGLDKFLWPTNNFLWLDLIFTQPNAVVSECDSRSELLEHYQCKSRHSLIMIILLVRAYPPHHILVFTHKNHPKRHLGECSLNPVIATFWPCYGIAHSSIRLWKRSGGFEGGIIGLTISFSSRYEHSFFIWQVQEIYFFSGRFSFTLFKFVCHQHYCHNFLNQPHSYKLERGQCFVLFYRLL